jgi:four helix bundle protein
MDSVELKSRTKRFALEIIRLVESLPKSMITMNLGKQLLRSATSVGANYRAACRARSRADFISKITIVEEEADESLFWMELLQESGTANSETLSCLMNEARELTAIFTTSGQTAKHRR